MYEKTEMILAMPLHRLGAQVSAVGWGWPKADAGVASGLAQQWEETDSILPLFSARRFTKALHIPFSHLMCPQPDSQRWNPDSHVMGGENLRWGKFRGLAQVHKVGQR